MTQDGQDAHDVGPGRAAAPADGHVRGVTIRPTRGDLLLVEAGWTRVRRVMAALATIGLLVVAVAVLDSYGTVRSLEEELAASDRVSAEFIDVQRRLAKLELAVATTQRLDDPAVDEALALLGRPLQIAESRLGRPTTSPSLTADIETVLAAVDLFLATREADPTDVTNGRAFAGEAERLAKTAADRTETERRDALIAQVRDARSTTARTAVAAGAALLLSVMLILALRHRFATVYAQLYTSVAEHAVELERSNDELIAANEAKQRFVSMVSHELRTPLTVVRGFAETLVARGEHLSPERRNELATAIVRQAERQERIVSDLLLVARFADASPEPTAVAFDLNGVIDGLRQAGIVGPRTTVLPGRAPDGGACTVWADRGHTEQVLENLLTNAEKYGGEHVRVSWEQDGDRVRIRVEDDGAGIDEAFAAVMFDPFTQADSGDTRRSSGVGLGLSITRTLVEANGGTITYEGGLDGAAFDVRLPCGQVAATGLDEAQLRSGGRRRGDRGITAPATDDAAAQASSSASA